jgi:hypothetical protein
MAEDQMERDRNRRGNRDNDDRNGRDDDWRNNNGGYNNRYPNNQNNMPAMSDAAFNQVFQNVRSKMVQLAKVTAVRDAFNNTANYFSTYQTRQLLGQITSETNRLELAKASYRNVVDKISFSQLYDLFSSQAHRDELDRYVRSYRY